MTNREIKRAEARRRANEWGPEYREVTRRDWPNLPMGGVTRVFQNNQFVAMVYDGTKDPEGFPATMVRLRPNTGKPLGASLFQVLQDCKNQLFGPEARGAMYLPKVSELEDEANLYWFFVRSE